MVIIETPKVQLAVQLATAEIRSQQTTHFDYMFRSKVMFVWHCDLPFETTICKCVSTAILISDLLENRVKYVVYLLNFLRDKIKTLLTYAYIVLSEQIQFD